jgi:hypothetical protein
LGSVLEHDVATSEVIRWVGALVVCPIGFLAGLATVVFRRRFVKNAERAAENQKLEQGVPRWMRGGNWSPPSETAVLVVGIAMMVASAVFLCATLLHLLA